MAKLVRVRLVGWLLCSRLCCVAWWPITLRTVGQPAQYAAPLLAQQTDERTVEWENGKKSSDTEDAALHLTPMGTFSATLFFNIKCQINSEMWHQKSPRAIAQFSVHCHLMWQTAAASASVLLVLRLRASFGSSNLVHRIMPNYKVKSFDRHKTHTQLAARTPTPSVGVFIMGR